jgi:hypothetical protein
MGGIKEVEAAKLTVNSILRESPNHRINSHYQNKRNSYQIQTIPSGLLTKNNRTSGAGQQADWTELPTFHSPLYP